MRRATFISYPTFAIFLVVCVQKSRVICDYSLNDISWYILCGGFEYFGSYWGNRGMIWARMGVTERLAD